MTNVLSMMGWAILPNLISGWIQRIYYGITIRAGSPHPQPGTPRFTTDRRRIQVLVVSIYLLYTIYEADHDLQATPNYYTLLSVSPDSTERAIKSRFRRLAALHHPDKASTSSSETQDHNSFFIMLKLASDTLTDPATRFAYERFGPDMHAWNRCVTIRDFMQKALTLRVPYYVASGGAMYALSLFGYLSSAKWWRWTFFLLLATFEHFVVTRPTFPPILDNVINPFLVRFTGHKPYLPFQLVALARQMSLTVYIAINQLGPLFRAANVIPEGEEEKALQEGLDRLEATVGVMSKEAARMVDMEMAPYVSGDHEGLKGLRGKVKDWLVQNTVRADPMVRDSINSSVRRRRMNAPHGARGNR